ncbi:cytochrome P450 [Dentipellis sp. KUC8613]|nr:cytochrome P450 [Dentipellis sp. KUC8613]
MWAFDRLGLSAALCCAFLSILAANVAFLRRRRSLPLPPGPPGIPFIGNIYSVPSRTPWVQYMTWSRELMSDVISLQAFGETTIIINTRKAAKELLVHRSSTYADRPRVPMLELMTMDFVTGFLPYSEEWRTHRKLFHRVFQARSSLGHASLQLLEGERLIQKLSEDPTNFIGHIRHSAAAIVMAIAYGHDVTSEHDRFVDIAEETVVMMIQNVMPGAAIVNVFPFWMKFKSFARKCASLVKEMLDGPFERVKCGMVKALFGVHQVYRIIKTVKTVKGEELIKRVAGTVFQGMNNHEKNHNLAGTDTTATAVTNAIVAFMQHPGVQRRAQADIDRVVGRNRLPTLDDQDNLPFIGAACREILRWKVIVPLGFPYKAMQDEIYEGRLIPKGTTVFGNVWALLNDPEVYPEPECFRPERFLNDDGTLNDDAVGPAFGFGRRICSGMDFAHTTIWIMVAHILAIFTIETAQDNNGTQGPADVKYSDGLLSHPDAFKCSIRVRDEEARELLRNLRSGRI